jgi:acyl-CoA synthetase (NDP forming)
MDNLSDIRPFFHPRAVAVVGVSRDPWKFGSVMFSSLQQFCPTTPLYPVSSRAEEFMGRKAFPSVSALPPEVDLVFLCLPAPLVPQTVRECSEKGIPAVIIPGGGFKETGTEEGKRLQEEVQSVAGPRTRIMGPNCFGVYSPSGGVTILPGQSYPRQSGSVGFFAQSGGITEDFCSLLGDYGCYVSQAVSYGNACDVNEMDVARYFSADENTRVVASYLEGVRDGKNFFDLVQTMAASKPTILWKAGLTPGGARAAASHTGSLAGSDTAWTAFFKQTGAIQVFSMEELLDTVSAFYHLPATADPRVALVAGGGGVGVSGSDACHRAGLTLPTFEEKTRGTLTAILRPTGANRRNPVDCDVPFPRPSALKGVLETIAASGEVGSIVIDKIALSPRMRQLGGYDRQVGGDDEPDEPWLEELPVRIRNEYQTAVIAVLGDGGEPLGTLEWEIERRRLRKYYQENGVSVYPTVQRALNALGKVTRYYQRVGHSK